MLTSASLLLKFCSKITSSGLHHSIKHLASWALGIFKSKKFFFFFCSFASFHGQWSEVALATDTKALMQTMHVFTQPSCAFVAKRQLLTLFETHVLFTYTTATDVLVNGAVLYEFMQWNNKCCLTILTATNIRRQAHHFFNKIDSFENHRRWFLHFFFPFFFAWFIQNK